MASIKDIAREAKVSVATVSHVLNGTRKVAPATTQRVMDAIQKYHYIPNTMARSLRTNDSKTIAVIVQDISNGFFANVVESMATVLYAKGYTMLLCVSQNNHTLELQHFRTMIEKQVSGIILSPMQMDLDYRKLCPTTHYPLVFIDRTSNIEQADTVVSDNYYVTYQAVSELIACGHRAIACLFNDHFEEISTNLARMRAYEDAHKNHSMALDPSLVRKAPATVEDGYIQTEKILQEKKATAIFAIDNVFTIGAMRCLLDREVPVPQKMAVIGFDDYDWSAITAPPVSCVAQPMEEMGKQAAEMIVKRIQNPTRAYEKIVLESKLVLRGSC